MVAAGGFRCLSCTFGGGRRVGFQVVVGSYSIPDPAVPGFPGWNAVSQRSRAQQKQVPFGNGRKKRKCKNLVREVLVGDGGVGAFAVPEDLDDPVAVAGDVRASTLQHRVPMFPLFPVSGLKMWVSGMHQRSVFPRIWTMVPHRGGGFSRCG
jgi:hypothetical protein